MYTSYSIVAGMQLYGRTNNVVSGMKRQCLRLRVVVVVYVGYAVTVSRGKRRTTGSTKSLTALRCVDTHNAQSLYVVDFAALWDKLMTPGILLPTECGRTHTVRSIIFKDPFPLQPRSCHCRPACARKNLDEIFPKPPFRHWRPLGCGGIHLQVVESTTHLRVVCDVR